MWLLLASAIAGETFADLVRTHALTASDERQVGELTFTLSTAFLPLVQDEEMVARVERVLRRVIRASDRPGQIVQLRIIDDPTINAAAYPGGFMVVNRGTVEAFDADELAFVLAHELAHVQLRHYANGKNLEVALDRLSSVARARAGVALESDRTALFEVRTLLAHYGRQLEFEADLYGLLFLVRAGRPAASALSAMAKLEALETRRQADVLDGHPSAQQRGLELQKGLASLLRSHHRFQEGVAALNTSHSQEAVPAFEAFLTVFPQSTAAWTNLAIAHHVLVVSGSDDPWFERLPVRIDSGVRVRGSVAAGRAYDAASRALALDPDHSVALAVLSSLARHAGHAEAAGELLDRAERAGLDATTVAVNRGVLHAESKEGLRAWEALADDSHAIANRAVWYQRHEQPGLAAQLYRTLRGTKLEQDARIALASLGETLEPSPAPGRLGPIRVGEAVEGLLAAYGEPESHHGADLGGFYDWPEHGVTAYTYADRVHRLLCMRTCDWTHEGVGLGASQAQVLQALGPAEREKMAYGGERWTYASQGLSFHFDAAGVMSIEQALPR